MRVALFTLLMAAASCQPKPPVLEWTSTDPNVTHFRVQFDDGPWEVAKTKMVRKGTYQIPMPKLEPGPHVIKLKGCWDAETCSDVQSLEFVTPPASTRIIK